MRQNGDIMKILRKISLILLSVLLIITPLIAVAGVAIITPAIYSKSFVGALNEKYERLTTIKEDKIIVVGGSSVAFGINSEYIEDNLEMPVVNFGLYGALGTVAMLELSLAGVREGDVVVLAPELDAQTMSMYFNSREMLRALDDDYTMASNLSIDNKLSLIGGLFEHAGEKMYYFKDKARPENSGIYAMSSFNEYLDIDAGLRTKNVLPLYYDPSTPILLDESIVEDAFLDKLNAYIEECQSRGATVYFSFCPINRLAVENEENKAEFIKFLEDNINCEIISDIDKYILDEAYFYDTNLHLNDAGVIVRSNRLIKDLGKAMDVSLMPLMDPPPPALPVFDYAYDGDVDENAKYFTFEVEKNGCIRITGLTELGKQQSSLTIPLGHEGRRVFSIGKNAFSGGIASKVTVTSDTNLRNFLEGSFDNSGVTDLYIYYNYTDDENKLFPAPNFGGLTIHVPEGTTFISSYDWSAGSTGGFDVQIIK